MTASLEIRLLGPFDVRLDARSLIPLPSRKAQWLLALLILRHERPVEREWLAGALWPESAPSQALSYLRHALVDLRKALGREAIRVQSPTHQTLRLDLTGVSVDLLVFDAAVARGEERDLKRAISLYCGALLDGCSEEWVHLERQAREQVYLSSIEAVAEQSEARGDASDAIGYLRRLIAIDPLRERAQRALMRSLAMTGDYAAALQVYRELRLLLLRERHPEPAPETRALFDRIRAEVGKRIRPESAEAHGAPSEATAIRLEPVGGAVPLDSAFYIVRPADEEFKAAIAGRDSIVLVKGGRQVGKSSLLARGLQQAREQGARVALTDLQTLNATHLASADALCRALASTLALQLDLPIPPGKTWDPDLGANLNLEWYVRDQCLNVGAQPVVWGLDEVDRLFGCPFAGEIFGLFRSWHNRRALEPTGPWSRLTLAIAYATEAHLFITDLNQSPFNVGTRLTLEDFTPEQVTELNRRYGAPLRADHQHGQFYRLLGGQPYLTRRGLYEMTIHGWSVTDLEAKSALDEGPFSDHLRRMHTALMQDARLVEAVHSMLREEARLPAESFYRLRSAGVISGDSIGNARLRCQLYASYLALRLM